MVINEANLRDVGDNVKATEVDGLIVLVIDPSVDLGLAASGKSHTVATSRAFQPLMDNRLTYNLWVGRYLK